MSIRTRLLALALAIVLPGVIGALFGLYGLYQQQTHVATRNLSEIAAAVASVIGRELSRRETTLNTLALSPALRRGDLKAFYEFARAAAPTVDRTIILTDLEQQQVINTRVPFGEPLPRSKSFVELRAGARPDETVLSDLTGLLALA